MRSKSTHDLMKENICFELYKIDFMKFSYIQENNIYILKTCFKYNYTYMCYFVNLKCTNIHRDGSRNLIKSEHFFISNFNRNNMCTLIFFIFRLHHISCYILTAREIK